MRLEYLFSLKQEGLELRAGPYALRTRQVSPWKSQIQGSAVDQSTFRYQKKGLWGSRSKTDHNQKDQVQWRRHRGGSLDNHRAYRVRQLILVGAHRAAFSLAHGPTRTKRLTTSAKKKAQQRRRVCEHIYCKQIINYSMEYKKENNIFLLVQALAAALFQPRSEAIK